MDTINNKKGMKKGWMMVGVCMLIQAIPFGIASNIQPLFIYPVTTEFGFSLAAFSLIFTIGTIVSSVAAPFIGALFNKINIKVIYMVGAILTGGGFMLYGLCNQLWQFYSVAAFVQIGTAIVSAIGVPLIINSWFDAGIKGKALGISFAGGSIGNIFLQQLAVRSIASNGPSKTYIIYGFVALVVTLIIAIFLVQLPKNDSEIVHSHEKSTENVHGNTSSVDISYTLNEVKRNKYFWMLSLGLLFVGFYVSAYSVQYAAYFQGELNLSTSVIATAGSIFALLSLFGNVVGGILLDKLGVVKTLLISSIVVFGSGIALLFTGQIPILAHVFSGLKGITVFIYMMAPAYIVGEYFGKKEYGSILGVANLLFAVGFSTGSALFAVIAQMVGYNTTWIIILGCVVAAFILMIGASKGMERMNKQRRIEFDDNDKIAR